MSHAFTESLYIDTYDDTKTNKFINAELGATGKELARYLNASEGQRVFDNFYYRIQEIGRYVRDCENNNNRVIVLIDGIDSGVSIDLINTYRDFLELLKSDCEKSKLEYYIVVTANNFAMIEDYKCIWIPDLSEKYFDSVNAGAYHSFRHLFKKK